MKDKIRGKGFSRVGQTKYRNFPVNIANTRRGALPNWKAFIEGHKLIARTRYNIHIVLTRGWTRECCSWKSITSTFFCLLHVCRAEKRVFEWDKCWPSLTKLLSRPCYQCFASPTFFKSLIHDHFCMGKSFFKQGYPNRVFLKNWKCPKFIGKRSYHFARFDSFWYVEKRGLAC